MDEMNPVGIVFDGALIMRFGMEAVNFRSDAVTLPTKPMFHAMVTARLGEDSRDGDPTVVKLEAMAAT